MRRIWFRSVTQKINRLCRLLLQGTLSSTLRSLALASVVKEGREIVIIGHTDCHVCQTTALQLLDKLSQLGVARDQLPENLNEFFGMFATERQNVIKGCGYVRQSPLIGPKIPVHGLLVDIHTGKLEWVVNGYEVWQTAPPSGVIDLQRTAGRAIGALGSLADFDLGEMKFPDQKIGDAAGQRDLGAIQPMVASLPPSTPSVPPAMRLEPPPPISGSPSKKPLPPPIRPRIVKPW